MARAARRAAAPPAEGQVTFIYLIKHTELGMQQAPKQKQTGQKDVWRKVADEGGSCKLYSTRGAAYDYVSVMTGLTSAAAIRIAAEIEKNGTVKAILLSGLEIVDYTRQA